MTYSGEETKDFHERNYLKTGPGLPYSDLHASMRKHGIDWFTFEETNKKIGKPRPESVKKKSLKQ